MKSTIFMSKKLQKSGGNAQLAQDNSIAFAAAIAFAAPIAARADEGVFGPLTNDDLRTIFVNLAESVISWVVPAVVLVVVTIISKAPPEPDVNDLPPFLAQALGMSNEPKEYLKVEGLNAKLLSFDYSLQKEIVSKDAALRANRLATFSRNFGAELGSLGLSASQIDRLEKDVVKFNKADSILAKKLDAKLRELRARSISSGCDFAQLIDSAMDDGEGEAAEGEGEGAGAGVTPNATMAEANARHNAEEYTTDSAATLVKSPPSASSRKDVSDERGSFNERGSFELMKAMQAALQSSQLSSEINELREQRLTLETSLLASLSSILTPDQATSLATAVKHKGAGSSAIGVIEALRSLASSAGVYQVLSHPPKVFVLKFFGDVTASQVGNLRQEVTAVLRNANASAGDEVLLVLNTGGGTVTGYGLAAAQLTRIKSARLRLTICVEQVAASGGYMMACVADYIVASPFAVLGSIGVLTEIPNVYERLKKEGVKFSTITAGKYKRTLTPTKKVEAADVQKQQEDIEQVLNLFKAFVKQNRPGVDIERVATGETWFGPDALEHNLVDHLATTDEVLLEHVDKGARVISISYSEKEGPLAALGGRGSSGQSVGWKDWLMSLATRVLLLEGSIEPSSASDSLLGRSDEWGRRRSNFRTPPSAPSDPLFMRPRGAAEPQLRWKSGTLEDSGDASLSHSDVSSDISHRYEKSWGWSE